MNIQGLQKLTLLDYPEHTACTVFTGGCNLRCPFCHNVPLVLDPTGGDRISEEEFFSFLSTRKGLLDGVAVTGGDCRGAQQADSGSSCKYICYFARFFHKFILLYLFRRHDIAI